MGNQRKHEVIFNGISISAGLILSLARASRIWEQKQDDHRGGEFRGRETLGHRLHGVQPANAAVGAHRRLFRLLRQAEAEHHLRVPHRGQEHGHFPHHYVHDRQVIN